MNFDCPCKQYLLMSHNLPLAASRQICSHSFDQCPATVKGMSCRQLVAVPAFTSANCRLTPRPYKRDLDSDDAELYLYTLHLGSRSEAPSPPSALQVD